jgi:cytochrome c-type biogenesis protein CcmH/NrfG
MRTVIAFVVFGFCSASASANSFQPVIDAFERGDTAEAKRLLAPLAKQQPNNPDVHFHLGKIALAEDRNDDAVKHLEKAIQLNPKNSDYHFTLGSAYGDMAMEASMLKQASLAKKVRNEFETAVQLNPRNVDARFGLIDFYLMAPGIMGGSREKAKDQVDAIRRIDPLQGHRAAARYYSREKQDAKVEQEYLAAAKAFPAEARPHAWLGQYATSREQYDRALAEYDTAMRLDPSYMPAYLGYGRAAGRSGKNLDRGAELLRKYLAYQPKPGEPGHATAYFLLGVIHEKKGERAQAKQNFAAALKLAPKSKEIAAALKRVS